LRFRDPLNRERRFTAIPHSAFNIPHSLDAPLKGSLAQCPYIDWRPADREQECAALIAFRRKLKQRQECRYLSWTGFSSYFRRVRYN
jgi:hypothetical protein